MNENTFQFGNTYWKQLDGIAICTPTACSLTNIYVAVKERPIVKKYSKIIFYNSLIDDAVGIWGPNILSNIQIQNKLWDNFLYDMNNACTSKWIFSSLKKTINIFDVTMSIEYRKIEFKTFQRELKKHQYITPHSSHPKSCLKGIIFGSLVRFYN